MSEAISLEDKLNGIPQLHPEVKTIFDKSHGYALMWELQEKKSSWFKRIFLQEKTHHRIALDSLGKRTVELIDGKRSVSTIAELLQKDLENNPEQTMQATLAFITELMKRNALIVIQSNQH